MTSLPPMSPTGRLGSVTGSLKTEIRKTSWLNDFTVEKTIGRGKFAVVKKCIEKSSGKHFAAKCIRKRRHCRDCTPDIFHEIAVLELSSAHPHLIDLYCVYETPSEVVLILEYAAGGEIFDHCVGVKDTFDKTTSKRLIKQILEAVSFLHDNEIVHLDLKPQNILLTEESGKADIKLVDFGLSKCVANQLEIREILGTPDYVAPEVLNFEPITTATDIWSLGVVSYVMLTGVSPFLGDSKQETLMNVTTAQLQFPKDLFEQHDHICKDFIKKMLQRDPSDRITASECLQHPFLSNVSISQCVLRENTCDEVFSDDNTSSSSEDESEDVDYNGNVQTPKDIEKIKILQKSSSTDSDKENIKSWTCEAIVTKVDSDGTIASESIIVHTNKPQRINRLSLAAARAFSQDQNNVLNISLNDVKIIQPATTQDAPPIELPTRSPTQSDQILKRRKFDTITPEKQPPVVVTET